MTITLTPALAKLVRESVERGDYANADAVIQEAVHRLFEAEETGRGELLKAIQDGIDDLDRGDFVDYDEQTIEHLAEDVHRRGLARLDEDHRISRHR